MQNKLLKSFFKVFILCIVFSMYLLSNDCYAQNNFEKDTIQTTQGKLVLSFIGHGTLMFEFNNQVIHLDPVTREADYKKMPKGDIVLVTHQHFDHLDPTAIENTSKKETEIILTKKCIENVEELPGKTTILSNGETISIQGLSIEAVPAYNMKHTRKDGNPFHPKGEGNGYVITMGETKVYIAGDTENIPEMANLKDIDVAFLPMNLPYTMTPEMVANAAKTFTPKILYPYHYGNTDTSKLVELLKDEKNIEVRIRNF